LSNALNGFEGKALYCSRKKVKYMSLETNCFNPGSWSGSEGKSVVVELGKVLGENPDIAV
jgi:chemotaxis protein MotB